MEDQVSIPTSEVLLAKRVQEMAINDEDPIGPFLCRKDDDNNDIKEEDIENSPIPVIDLERCCSKEIGELEKLKSALSSWGCFQAIGHGISTSFLDDVRQVGRDFFKQPMEEKSKYAKGVNEFEGYGGDPAPEKGQPLDWSDRLFLSLVPKDERKYEFWPQNPTCFRNTLDELGDKMENMTKMVSKSMALSLGLEENTFLDEFGARASLGGRFNYYPTCKWADLVMGLKPHADGSGYTILMQDQLGLQILNHGRWYTVPKKTGSLLVIMGDQMEIISNGVFTSPVHRVLSDSRRDRFSLAVFYTPETGKDIGPVEGLIDPTVPAIFKKVKDYSDTHWGYYMKGMRSLHVAKV